MANKGDFGEARRKNGRNRLKVINCKNAKKLKPSVPTKIDEDVSSVLDHVLNEFTEDRRKIKKKNEA